MYLRIDSVMDFSRILPNALGADFFAPLSKPRLSIMWREVAHAAQSKKPRLARLIMLCDHARVLARSDRPEPRHLRRPRLGFCKKFLDYRFLSPCNQKKPGRKQPPGTRISYGVGPRGITDQLYAVASTTDLSGARPCVTVAQEQISKFPVAHDVACKCARDGCRRGEIRGGWTLDLKRAVRLPNTLADAIIAVLPSEHRGRVFLKRLGQ